MKLGIITDIHEHVEALDAALSRFNSENVEQVITIGDLFETGEKIESTCQRLADVGAIGVWGNHDLGLCLDVDQETSEKYSDDVLKFMGSLKPRLEIGDCYFMHNEPWLNPTVLEDLWYWGGPPSSDSDLERIFGAVPHKWTFAGHYHQWMLMTPSGFYDWHGERPICLDEDRFFIVVGALFEGHAAILDTDTAELIPITVPKL